MCFETVQKIQIKENHLNIPVSSLTPLCFHWMKLPLLVYKLQMTRQFQGL